MVSHARGMNEWFSSAFPPSTWQRGARMAQFAEPRMHRLDEGPVLAAVAQRYALARLHALRVLASSRPPARFSVCGCACSPCSPRRGSAVRPGFAAAVLATFCASLMTVAYPLVGGFRSASSRSAVEFVWGGGARARARVLRDRALRAGHGRQRRSACGLRSSPRMTVRLAAARRSIGFAPGTDFASRNDFSHRSVPPGGPPLVQAFSRTPCGKTTRFRVEARVVRDGQTRWVQVVGIARATVPRAAALDWHGETSPSASAPKRRCANPSSATSLPWLRASRATGIGTSTNGCVVSPRANELSGFAATTWVNRDEYRARINMHPDDCVRWEAARRPCSPDTGDRLAMEVRYIVNGEARWHQPDRPSAGATTRARSYAWTGSTTDITARKLARGRIATAERKLRQAQRAGGDGHAGRRHRARLQQHPRRHPRLRRDGAARRAQGQPPARATSTASSSAGERGRALVDRVLAFSRSGVERTRAGARRGGGARGRSTMLASNLPAGVTVHAQLHAGRAAMLGDATQVHQVVMNLVHQCRPGHAGRRARCASGSTRSRRARRAPAHTRLAVGRATMSC